MGKKKKSKKNKGLEPEVRTFADALRLIFANTVPKHSDDIVAIRVETIPRDEFEMAPAPLKMSEYEIECENIYGLMTDEELAAYDLLDNFIHTEKAGLPDDPTSLEARIEHAEWNNEVYHNELLRVMADFEAAIAYYVNIKVNTPEKTADLDKEFGEIERCLNRVRLRARELERLLLIEEADCKMNEASVIMDEAHEDREILTEELKELRAAELEADNGENS